ncbi:hypothetical protein K7X08_029002 [Anisodus acutangulus]|uniref:PMI1/PMIR1-2 C-terminal domain-containing protein n=1 Tax=Anisodus acutangulus TaxID=402998 RepID=A0A9Q1L193_9SOLA|nr:hypothetical protein K7X08_029002 [Anisodus acutangulus]
MNLSWGKIWLVLKSKKVKLHRPKSSNSVGAESKSEYISLEDLDRLAMDKIEALSIEGLRIQSGMSDDDGPSNISPQSIGEFSAIEGKKVNFAGSVGLEGTGGLQLLDVKDNGGGGGGVDGLSVLSLTLEEWMRLKRRGKGKNCGLLGNNFTVALMVQLRHPLRNYELVGESLKTEQGKKKLWDSSTQQQSGSRWLLVNGMGKKNKHPLMKSKAGNKSSITAASSATTCAAW